MLFGYFLTPKSIHSSLNDESLPKLLGNFAGGAFLKCSLSNPIAIIKHKHIGDTKICVYIRGL